MNKPQNNLSKACIHTVTTRPWKLDVAIRKFADAGIGGISVWKSHLENYPMNAVSEMLKDSGLKVVSLVRGGFFTGLSQTVRQKSIDDNKILIEEASAINAPLLVLVCGSTPGQSLEMSRSQILESLEILLPFAESNKIKLAVEPLHPVFSDTRSAINTIKQANDLIEKINSPWLGIALDVYHVWWDQELESEINRCGNNNKLFAFHLCDWRVPTRDILNDRELMGKGIIDIQRIIEWVKNTGYHGMYEVEIFSEAYWSMDQDDFLSMILDSFQKYNFD